jgi:hypothetical protein
MRPSKLFVFELTRSAAGIDAAALQVLFFVDCLDLS